MTKVSVRDTIRIQKDLVDRLGDDRNVTSRLVDKLAEAQDLTDFPVHRTMYDHVRYARPYHVAENMTPVIMNRFANTERIPLEGKFGEDFVPPRTSGFVVFDEPIEFVEMRGRSQLIHMLTWGAIRATNTKSPSGALMSGWIITTWNDMFRKPDEVAQEIVDGHVNFDMSVFGRWHPINHNFMRRGAKIGDTWLPLTQWDYDAANEHYPDGPPIVNHEIINLHRVNVALWQLLSEETGAVEHAIAYPDRSALRMARRYKMETDISVITLRRAHTAAERRGIGHPLNHRVPVIEHYRTYWVKDPDTGALRPEKRKIKAHIRGPEGTPLIVRPKVENLIR